MGWNRRARSRCFWIVIIASCVSTAPRKPPLADQRDANAAVAAYERAEAQVRLHPQDSDVRDGNDAAAQCTDALARLGAAPGATLTTRSGPMTVEVMAKACRDIQNTLGRLLAEQTRAAAEASRAPPPVVVDCDMKARYGGATPLRIIDASPDPICGVQLTKKVIEDSCPDPPSWLKPGARIAAGHQVELSVKPDTYILILTACDPAASLLARTGIDVTRPQQVVLSKDGKKKAPRSSGHTKFATTAIAELRPAARVATRVVAPAAPAAAEPPAPEPPAPEPQQIDYSQAVTLGGSSCVSNNCAAFGWTSSDGSLNVSCISNNCLVDGWSANFSDGTTIYTSCLSRRCSTEGWSTTWPDGSVVYTSCLSQNCLANGWTSTWPDGSTITSTCVSQNCFADGWTTSYADGTQVYCTCQSGSCLKWGFTCS
jgi:hypothetical protein